MTDAFRYLARGLAALALLATPAAAQTYSISVYDDPALGNVVAANTGATAFRFTPSGTVSTLSGNGVRASGGTVRGAVQITCTGQANACSAASRVRIGSVGSPTGKAGGLSNFTVAIGSGGTISSVSGTNPVDFTVTPQNKNSKPIIYFGADVSINGNDGAGAVGSATSGYYAYVAPAPTTPTSGAGGQLTAVVSRPISLTGSPNLIFGTVMKPTTGAGSVSLNPANNTRTVAGAGAGGLNTPTPMRATYTVTGEGGQAVSVSVPQTFAMTGSGGSDIQVNLIGSGLPAALSAAPGSEGSATFYVGGTFNMSADMPVGDYSGVYTVTAQYN